MPRDPIQVMSPLPGLFAMPFKRYGKAALDSTDRLLCCQLEMLRASSHFFLDQWRQALEVNDVRGLQEFLARQAESANALGRKLTEQASDIGRIGQDFARQSLHAPRQVVEDLAATAGPSVAEPIRETRTGVGRRA